MEKERSWGIEVLRILSALMVITLHVLGQGGIYTSAGTAQNMAAQPGNYAIAWFFEAGAMLAVNLFALISGYVGATSEYKPGSYLRRWVTVSFWGVTIVALFAFVPALFEGIAKALAVILPGTSVSFKLPLINADHFLKAAFPLLSKQYWYFNAYTLAFFFSPVLNLFLQKASKREIKLTLIGIIGVLSLLPTLNNRDLFVTSNGYSGIWLMALYLVGGYIRLYPPKKVSKWRCVVGYFLTTVISWGTYLILSNFEKESILFKNRNVLVRYTSLTMVVGAILLLVWAINLKVKGKATRAVLRFMAPTTFAVYIMHVQPVFWSSVMASRFWAMGAKAPWMMVLGMLGAVLIIFISCMLLERLRMLLFRITRLDDLLSFLGNQINRLWRGKQGKAEDAGKEPQGNPAVK